MTPLPRSDPSGFRALDPLDVRLAGATTTPARPGSSSYRPRWSLVGWSATSVPVALLLLIGMALGPQGIGLLPSSALNFLDPAIPFAIAAIGVLLGLGVGAHQDRDGRRLAIAALEGGVTLIAVTIGFLLLAPVLVAATIPPTWLWMFGVLSGICAATSLTLPTESTGDSEEHSRRVIALESLIAIVGGGVVLAFVREGTLVTAVSLTLQASIIVLLLATAGWLLLTQAASDTEQRVFTIAMLLLVGGVADYLSLSALLGGLVAGIFWQRAGSQARDAIRRDALFVQHPLLVLLLLVAGARVEITPGTLALAVGYVFLRAAGKTVGAAMARYAAPAVAPRDLGMQLLPPGVFGVAFVLNTLRAAGPDTSLLLAVVVLGTIGSELLARLIDRGGRAA